MIVVAVGGRKLWRGLAALVLACLGTAFFLGFLAGPSLRLVVAVSRIGKILPVYSVDTGGAKKVALSFDAAWGAEFTDKLLQILDQNRVKTTFFLTNIWLEDYPEKARSIAAAGHEIGLHSTTHPRFTSLSVRQMRAELLTNAQMVEKVTGYKARLFRPPFGDYNNLVIQTIQEMGFIPVQWDVDSLDWKDLSARQIVERVTSRVRPGSIVLFHNNGRHTAEALPEILRFLNQEGYAVLPVSGLLLPGDYYVDLNGVQRRK